MFDRKHENSQQTGEVMLQVVTLVHFTRLYHNNNNNNNNKYYYNCSISNSRNSSSSSKNNKNKLMRQKAELLHICIC